jgi:hypothetical protein
MKWLINILIIFSAHFSLTSFAPAKDGKWFLWPFGQDSFPIYSFIGGLPAQSNGMITTILSGIAGLSFVLSLMARFGWLFPAAWIAPLLIIASICSIILFIIYFNVWAVLPIVIDLAILWLVITKKI